MTSSSRPETHRGFTLAELLVVMAILILLASIVLPMVGHAYNVARRARMAADLQVISEALEAYRHDFGDYPRPPLMPESPPVTGAARLCWALVAPGPAVGTPPNSPGDGADGPGFRLRGTTGDVKGPYLPPDRFTIGTVMNGAVSAAVTFNNSQDVLADRNNSPILYFSANRTATPTTGFVANASGSVFNFAENAQYMSPSPGVANPASLMGGMGGPGWAQGQNAWMAMSYRLGDTNHNGVIDKNETPVCTGPYLLWCASPSVFGRFGNEDDVVSNGTDLQLVTGPLPP